MTLVFAERVERKKSRKKEEKELWNCWVYTHTIWWKYLSIKNWLIEYKSVIRFFFFFFSQDFWEILGNGLDLYALLKQALQVYKTIKMIKEGIGLESSNSVSWWTCDTHIIQG